MLDTVSILINGITLALAVGLLLIVLWHDAGKALHQFFAVFLLMVLVWNAGALLSQAALLADLDPALLRFSVAMMELGFTGASVGIFALTTTVVHAQTRGFRALAFLSLGVVLIYRLLMSAGGGTFEMVNDQRLLNYQAQPLLIAFYLIFDGGTLYLIWRHRRKIRSQEILSGITLFVIGQSFVFLNPDLQAFTLATVVCAVGALVTSFALLKQDIITPLAERMSQVEAIHRVSLAITSQTQLDTVLEQIATQAARWLRAEAVGIWLLKDGQLELTTVYNLPRAFLQRQLAPGQGVIGTVAQSRQSMHLEDYKRDWRGVPDLPVARETFGSVIAAPLTYGGDVTGVLLVIAARDGRLFDKDDVYLLELLGAQAAVAISNGHLFAEQQALAQVVESSRRQLETVLTSTQSPVIAVSRSMEILFANPAARALIDSPDERLPLVLDGQRLIPDSVRTVLGTLRREGRYTFEVTLKSRVYLVMVTPLRTSSTEGYVALLNDITQLIELDRMKNEMMRMTSHDLKNPLQAAMVNLDLAREDLEGSASPEVNYSLEVVERQLGRMNRIIRGILDLERARTGAYRLEPTEPHFLVSAVVDELRHQIDQSGIDFASHVADDLPEVACDSEQVKRALVNLVENALKFTPNGGQVTLSASGAEGGVRFAVSDTGVGIPFEAQSRVFDRFFRVNQAGTEHVTGSGLGLSLVKTIAEHHGGRVWFESAPGDGTTFYLELPRGVKSGESKNHSG